MRTFVCILSIVLLAFYSNAQRSLVGNKGGRWSIHTGTKKTELPHTYFDVGNFDNRGLTSFREFGKYGILNVSGSVVCAAKFISIRQLGGGVYVCLDSEGKKIIDFTTYNGERQSPGDALQLGISWYKIMQDSSYYLLNTISGNRMMLDSSIVLKQYGFNHVLIETNGKHSLLNPEGGSISIGNKLSYFSKHYLDYVSSDERKIVFSDHEITLPATARSVKIIEEKLFYSHLGKSYILNCSDGSEEFSADYDKLNVFNQSHYQVYKNKKVGLIKKDGREVIPPRYNFIVDSKSYYTVYSSGGTGAVDLSGNELVPCNFKSIQATPDFFIVESDLGLKGVYSRKNQKRLLESIYERVEIRYGKIRAWVGEILRIIEVDEKHVVTRNLTLTNTITLKSERNVEPPKTIDSRLFSLGWFLETTPTYDSLGFRNGENHKWGLKGENDSVLISPKYNDLMYVPGAAYSLVPRGEVQLAYAGHPLRKNGWVPYSFSRGMPLANEIIISIDTTDLQHRSFSRFLGGKGPGILTEKGKIIHADFIDSHEGKYLRYCTSRKGRAEPSEKGDPTAIRFPSLDANDKASEKVQYRIGNKEYEHVKFEDGEWNYFDVLGKPLFSESFDFAQQYHRETAIVRQNGRWGVVRADSFVVGCSYTDIKRVEGISDTLFYVKNASGGKRVLDTLAKELPGASGVVKSYENYAQVQYGREKKLLDRNYNIVSAESKTQKYMNDGFFYYREAGKFVICDEEGNVVTEVRTKPMKILQGQYVLLKSKGRLGLVDFDEDTLLNFNNKNIRAYGSFIYANDGENKILYNQELSLLRKLKSSKILIDEVSGNIAIVEPSKCLILDVHGEEVRKVRNINPSFFYNNTLIETGNSARYQRNNDKMQEFPFGIKHIELMDEHGLILLDRKRNYHVYTSEFTPFIPDSSFKKARYVGEGFVYAKAEKGSVLFSKDQSMWQQSYRFVKGKFSEGLIVVRLTHRETVFLNKQLKNEFNQSFADAEGFKDGYATIKGVEGWSIIDRNGILKSLPTFDRLIPEGMGLFSTAPQALTGLYDSHGGVILPIEFQKIEFLDDNLIQAVKEGEIYYFERNGSPIELNP